VATTVNVAVCPEVTVWFPGCVLIVGATAAAFAVKLTPVMLVPLTVVLWLLGVNA